jgi:hypothetical protein
MGKRKHAGQDGKRPGYREQVIAAGRLLATGQERVVRVVVALDRSGEWALDGSPTCAHWVARALDVEVSTAREWLRIGRALEELALVDTAFREGRLSYSKVRALTRVAAPENEHELCELAERTPAGRLPHALAGWLMRHEEQGETDRRQHRARSMKWRVEPDGMIVGTFRLPPAAGASVIAAIDAIVSQSKPMPTGPEAGDDASADASGPSDGSADAGWPTIAQQRADALVEVIDGGAGAPVAEVVMHVRADGCSLDDGTPITGSVVERIAPAAFLRVLIHDANSRPINASGRQRHPTMRQKRVVKERDRCCVDCGSTEFLESDHDPPYEQSRRTVVDELTLRCRDCHRARQDPSERKPSRSKSSDRPASDAA